jgi:hypothetical protein
LGWVAAFNIAMSVLDEGYSRTYYWLANSTHPSGNIS